MSSTNQQATRKHSVDECKECYVEPDTPMTLGTILGRKLGFVSHVRCEQLTKVVAKLTTGWTGLPSDIRLKQALAASLDAACPGSPFTIPERNILLASEMGKRLQTACFEQGLKTLFIIHIFMINGDESFRNAISADPALLHLDRASLGTWLLSDKVKQLNSYIKKYGSYLNDLSSFFALAKPYDLYYSVKGAAGAVGAAGGSGKSTPLPSNTQLVPGAVRSTSVLNIALGNSAPRTAAGAGPVTFSDSLPLDQAKYGLNEMQLQELMASALALFKAAYALTPDPVTASHPVIREMVKLVSGDIKILYTFLTETFYHQIRCKGEKKTAGASNNNKQKKQRVDVVERGLALYDAYETACAEVSVYFATAASHNIISSTPKLKPVPRSFFSKLALIVKNAKASGIEEINWGGAEEDGEEDEGPRESLLGILQMAPSDSGSQPVEGASGSEGGVTVTVSEDTTQSPEVMSPIGSVATPNTRVGRQQSSSAWLDDSLASLRSIGGEYSPSTTFDSKDMDDESEDDVRALLTGKEAPAVMVAATSNSASAARRFHLLKDDVLGKGGFGTVYKAWDKHEGMYAACKEIPIDQRQTNIQELFSEFRTATTVSHENIVKTLMFSMSSSTGSIFMEWLPAGSLHQVLAQTKQPFPERLVRRYIRDALQGLAYLHRKEIVHRDIKLSNMLLSVGGKVKLTDFGSSKLIINTSFKTETIVGTVPYMSPEAVRGTYSMASDIWAIGCSIIEMLTVKHPWAEKGERDQIAMIFFIGSLQAPNHMPPYGDQEAVSQELRSFIEMCFVFDHHNRPSAVKLLDHPFLTMEEEDVVL